MSLPKSDNDLVIWLNRFSKAFETRAALFGFTNTEVAGVASDAAMFAYLIDVELPAYAAALSARTEYKNLMKEGPLGAPGRDLPRPPPTPVPPAAVDPGILPRVHQLIRRVISSPAYTKSLGEELGVFGWEEDLEHGSVPDKPSGRAIGQLDNEVRVEFAKSAFDGVLIESRRTGQDEWSRLCKDSVSPYVDSRPLVRTGKPEVREYRMRFLVRDEPVGEWSDILVATASY